MKFEEKHIMMAVTGLAVVAGAAGVIYGVHSAHKMNQVSKVLDMALDDFSKKNVRVDVDNALVETAINRAVDVKTTNAVNSAKSAAIAAVKNDIHKAVSEAVESEYDRVKDGVISGITSEVAKIDVEQLQGEVRKKAVKIATDKFEADLTDIRKRYDKDLAAAFKVYSMISKVGEN